MRNSDLRDRVPQVDQDWVLSEIAEGIDLRSTPQDKLTRGEKWKVWLSLPTDDPNHKTKMDLIRELSHAPGKPPPGEPIPDVPVPWYDPGPQQLAAHEAKERVVLVAGGNRSGKSKWLAANLLEYAFKDYSMVWIIANDYHLAREEFNYIEMWLKWMDVPVIKVSKPQEGKWTLVTRWGAKIETMTGGDVTKVEMENLNAVGISEAGQTSQELLAAARLRVFQKRGNIYLSGILIAAQPWYVQALKKYKNGDAFGGWHSFSIPSWDNRAVFPLGEKDPEIENMRRELSPEEFARRVAAEPMPPQGLVFKDFDEEKHVVPITYYEIDEDKMLEAMKRSYSPFEDDVKFVNVPIEKKGLDGFTTTGWELPNNCEVEIAVDPGYAGGYAVLACVTYKDIVLVIDEVYMQHQYTEEVIAECKNREWWPRVNKGVIDIAGEQHQMNASEVEKWKAQTGIRLKTQFVPVEDGISRYRTFITSPENGKPRIYIDPRCQWLIWEHSNYKYPDHKADRPIREKPIDANNHAIKALTYFLVVKFGFVDKRTGTTSRKYVDRRPIKSRSASGGWRDTPNEFGTYYVDVV